MFGFLNIHKPRGITSRDVVNHIDRIVRPEKAGHAGTLDPLATGVLVVAVGPATRLIEYVQAQPKRYRATFLLGRASESEDIETPVHELPLPLVPTRAELEATLPKFLGDIQQVPPAYSALKVKGKRAYDLARRGKSVELAPRTITIHRIEIIEYEYPELQLDIRCGSGTYVRSLGRDIARALGTEAVMSALVRSEIGEFYLQDSCQFEELNHETILHDCHSPLKALIGLPKIKLDDDQLRRVLNGMTIACHDLTMQGEIVAIDSRGNLAALLQPREPGWLRPLRTFSRNQQPS